VLIKDCLPMLTIIIIFIVFRSEINMMMTIIMSIKILSSLYKL